MCFNRGKSVRTITFEQFKEALQELSKKRFKGKNDEEALQEMYKLIEGKGPGLTGVTVCYWSHGQIVSTCPLFYCSVVMFTTSLHNPQIQFLCEPKGSNCKAELD